MDRKRVRPADREVPCLNSEYLTGMDLAKAILSGTDWLGKNAGIVDELNVFPVPDGDTGKNMYLTLTAAVKEVQALEDRMPRVAEVSEAASTGSLMGARGNSGVIFSQLFRGFSSSLKDQDVMTAQDLARALQEAARVAYKAVMKPVEGTMLTVAKEAARGAYLASLGTKDICEVAKAALKSAQEALDRTPELLPILKEAGVVDAGGKGLVIFLEGAIAGLTGVYQSLDGAREHVVAMPRKRGQTKSEPQRMGRYAQTPIVIQEGSRAPAQELAARAHPETLNYKYCTEFILKGRGLPLDNMRQDLAAYGDCLLVVGTQDVAKVHVHTNDPGIVLQYCVGLGDLTEIQINNMVLQNKEVSEKARETKAEAPEAEKRFAIVAVAFGEGLREILRSLGADEVIEGGQTMNPSIEDIVKAAEKAPSRRVIVLPNNSNVILTAEQARNVSEKEILVVPTKTIPQGIAALLAVGPDADLESARVKMERQIAGVRTGEVTYAVRNSAVNGFTIEENDIIGLADGDLKAVGKDRQKVALDLVREIITEDTELVTIYYGEKMTQEEASKLAERIQEEYPNCEIEVQYGGQPLYFYIISAE